jgi:rare lipoprotein A
VDRDAIHPGRAAAVCLSLALVTGGCSTGAKRDGAPDTTPDVSAVPDAVPRSEPKSRYGNPPFYEVFGQRYYVLDSGEGHIERGVASWYGEKFHGRRTSSGETYDMYAMTAAHKTLPLPVYARVTNLQNGRSVVVRINDRGPFIDNRIVDLSYTAAERLDMIGPGTALVELEVLDARPDGMPSPPAAAAATATAAPPEARSPASASADAGADADMFVQAGAFTQRGNAELLAHRLREGGLADVRVADGRAGDQMLYRVRIGPVSSVDDFDWTMNRLTDLGIEDAYLATD